MHLEDPERSFDLGMDRELIVVDHREYRIEMHECPGLRDVHYDDLLELAALQQVAGKSVDRGSGGPLAHADGYRLVVQDQDISAFD